MSLILCYTRMCVCIMCMPCNWNIVMLNNNKNQQSWWAIPWAAFVHSSVHLSVYSLPSPPIPLIRSFSSMCDSCPKMIMMMWFVTIKIHTKLQAFTRLWIYFALANCKCEWIRGIEKSLLFQLYRFASFFPIDVVWNTIPKYIHV